MANGPTCPECGMSGYLVVDGNEMTEEQLLHLRFAPKTIERRPIPHLRWCPSEDHRMRLLMRGGQ